MISVIVPIYNGADLVPACHAAVSAVLNRIDGGAEIIYVDDGSSDGTLEALRATQSGDSRVRIIELERNFGQHAALAAGLEHARGQYLVTMDVDLQCDPADIPRLLEPLSRGYDLVSGVRRDRKDPATRRLFSRITTAAANRFARVPLQDIGCPLNACTAEVAKNLIPFGSRRRFLKPLAVRVARRVAEVEVQHHPRAPRRKSSYSTASLVRLFMDFVVASLASDDLQRMPRRNAGQALFLIRRLHEPKPETSR